VILVIDNYDSFTYNLVQYLGELGSKVRVLRNDALCIDEIEKMKPTQIIVSPGPGTPYESGVSVDVIRRLGKHIPILGVCLGHQAIAVAFGGKIAKAKELIHGKTSPIFHDGKSIFAGVKNPFPATRYHSLAIDASSLPECLEISAWVADGTIMAVRHKRYRIEGVQFHPESVLTLEGKKILKNFLAGGGGYAR